MTQSTRRQKMERIAQAMFEHRSVQKAAAALGMSEVTVWRWTQKPEFPEAYSEVRREALSRSRARRRRCLRSCRENVRVGGRGCAGQAAGTGNAHQK